MRVLIALDDSPNSEGLLKNFLHRKYLKNSHFKLLVFLEPLEQGCTQHLSQEQREHIAISRHNSAVEFCRYAAKEIREKFPFASFHHEIKDGEPSEEILDVASKWFADMILIGEQSDGLQNSRLLGSVSRTVATHAPCSVEIMRKPLATAPN